VQFGVKAAVMLVDGLPEVGKTTLVRALSRRLRLPLFSKDVIKEAHADIFGVVPPGARSQ
jgi:MoxR-like ATPase